MIKSVLKKISPSAFDAVKDLWYSYTLKNARSAFNNAVSGSSFLSYEKLAALDVKFPVTTGFAYDEDSLKSRAHERFLALNKLFLKHTIAMPQRVLEIGCGDGMICCYFAEAGSKCIAIDNDESLFDKRASDKGVEFARMDAAALDFADNTFDFIFNYDIYEHLNNPQETFANSMRVLKPGGLMYIKFSPAYYSPFGFHAYNSIAVPYCQFLFSGENLKEFALQNNRDAIDYSFNFLNKVSIPEFRRIFNFKDNSSTFLEYREIQNLSFTKIISTYPSHFKSAGVDFENFIIEGFELLIRKKE